MDNHDHVLPKNGKSVREFHVRILQTKAVRVATGGAHFHYDSDIAIGNGDRKEGHPSMSNWVRCGQAV